MSTVLLQPLYGTDVGNPFPGLRPFTEQEEHLFFGRETQVDALIDKLAATHFLTVVGTSGSGKSSLVNCGLRPALHRGVMARAGSMWRMAQFRPGNHPIAAMAAALAEPGVLYDTVPVGPFPMKEIIESSLRMSKLGLFDAVAQAQLPENTNLLIVADQFEELFRFQQVGTTPGDTAIVVSEEAIAFVNLLLQVRDHPAARIYVVLTMRSDFLGECAQFYGLPEAVNQGQYLVPRMTRDERRKAIEGPVRVGGATIEPVLLTRLVNDVGANPDQLSILQHALNRTWARWRKDENAGPLTLQHYNDIGTMAHALDKHAEKAYGQITDLHERQICETLFKALTDKATDARGVRRPTNVKTLLHLTGANLKKLTRVVDVFRKKSRSFLMPPIEEALTPDTVIDISHESLMRVWDRLRNWADEEALSAGTYRRLSESAALWAKGKASFWANRDLQYALAWREERKPDAVWAERYAPGFAETMEFLDRSAEENKAKLQREARKEKNTERLITWLLAALLVTIISGISIYKQKDALENQTAALKREKNQLAETAKLARQLAGSKLLTAQSYAAAPIDPRDTSKVNSSVAAAATLSAITAKAPTPVSSVTVKYYRKSTDSEKLKTALEELGFDVTEPPAQNSRETNCIWYGPAVSEKDVKLVAYAVIRAGLNLQAIQLNPSAEPRSISVGHSFAFGDHAPFTADEVTRTPLAQLKRYAASSKENVRGTIATLNPTEREGTITGPEGPVYFRFVSDEAFKVGDPVTFTMYKGPTRFYAEKVTLAPAEPPPATQTAPPPSPQPPAPATRT